MDIQEITLEQIKSRVDSSPDLRAVLESEEFRKKLSEITTRYNYDLDPEEDLIIHQFATFVILSFINPSELSAEIKKAFGNTNNEIDKMSSEINMLIENSLGNTQETKESQPQSNPIQPPTPPQPHAQQPQPAPQHTPKPQEAQSPTPPQQPNVTNTPNPTPQPQKEPEQPEKPESPFVLQKRDEVKSNVETDVESKRPIRPSFYEAPSTSQKTEPENPTPKVKVDLGTEKSENPQSIPKKRDYTIHTPVENTTKDTGPITEEQEKSQVHPENVVDLKDLPK